MEKVNVAEKFKLIKEYYSPKIIGELNGSEVKAAKLLGEFVWHAHENEDEMFFIVSGSLTIRFETKDVELNPGEFIIIPKGVKHMPVAENEVCVLLIEPKNTLNTGNVRNEKTVTDIEKI